MLKNIRVITGIIIALSVFCLLQLVTGGLFYSAVNNDRVNFQNTGVLNAQQENLGDSVNTLIKTRVTVTRVAIRFLKPQMPKSWHFVSHSEAWLPEVGAIANAWLNENWQQVNLLVIETGDNATLCLLAQTELTLAGRTMQLGEVIKIMNDRLKPQPVAQNFGLEYAV